MPIVVIMCTPTGRLVTTGLRMDRVAFNTIPVAKRFSSHCWYCGGEHVWSKRWATLIDERDPVFAAAIAQP
jgi:hypothetical protein